MPASILKSLAKKHNLKLKTLERYWEEAKKQANKKFPQKGDAYFAYITSIVMNRAAARSKRNKSKANTEFAVIQLEFDFDKKIEVEKKKRHPEIILVKRSTSRFHDEEPTVKADMYIGTYLYLLDLVPARTYKSAETLVSHSKFKEASNILKPYIIKE